MSLTLVLTTHLHDVLRDAALEPLEAAGVLLARPVHDADGHIVRLIAVSYEPVPTAAYSERTARSLAVGSNGYMAALGKAERSKCVALWVHTHPGDGALPKTSEHDEVVDTELTPTFAARTNSGLYGALILATASGRITFSGHIFASDMSTTIDRLWVVGHRFELISAHDAPLQSVPALHDRNIRAFGPDVMRVLADLSIGIVGAGGHGSAVGEQLVRLGVRKLTIIDPKTLSDTNVTRVYGSTPVDVDRPKVDVLADHLERIAPEVEVQRVVGDLKTADVARALNTLDLVFCCTDDDAGRTRLSRYSYVFNTPVIDLGVLLDADGQGKVNGIFGRITLLHPGSACLICRGRVDLAIAAAQERPREELEALAAEGYAPALPGVEPAVVAYTTLVAATAVAELLERLVGYGPATPPSELLLRIHDRKISGNRRSGRPGHYCDPSTVVIKGQTEPLWGLNWVS
jgi:hypothetical protein